MFRVLSSPISVHPVRLHANVNIFEIMKIRHNSVHSQTVAFEFKGTQVYGVWHSLRTHHDIYRVLFLGTGQSRFQARSLARRYPGTAVVQAPPHWRATFDGRDTQRFMYSFTEAIASDIFSKSREPLLFIAESQAVPGVVYYALRHPDRVEQLVMLQPLGLNRNSFGSTPAERLEEFRLRIKANYRQNLPRAFTDIGWVSSQLSLLYTIKRHSLHNRRVMQYDAGLRHSICGELSLLKSKVPLSIVVGADDKIFQPAEIKESLRFHNLDWINLTVVQGIAHTPLNSRNGRKLWFKAFVTMTD
jgi:pimeloyl-ACP methyl ester carboxylesterase